MADLVTVPGKQCRFYIDMSGSPNFATPTLTEVGYLEEGKANAGVEVQDIHGRAGRGAIMGAVSGFKPVFEGKLTLVKTLSDNVWNEIRKRCWESANLGKQILIVEALGLHSTAGNKCFKCWAIVTKFDENHDNGIVTADIAFQIGLGDDSGNIYEYFVTGS